MVLKKDKKPKKVNLEIWFEPYSQSQKIELLTLEILNGFYRRRLKWMERLEILGVLLTLNPSRIKSQLFLRNSSLKGIYNTLPRNTFKRTMASCGCIWEADLGTLLHPDWSRWRWIWLWGIDEAILYRALLAKKNKWSIQEKHLEIDL